MTFRLRRRLMADTALRTLLPLGALLSGFAVLAPAAAGDAANADSVLVRVAQANPCAATNPYAAANPCHPCAAGGGSSASAECFVPGLRQAASPNPCAAANPCAANPCGANPCGANPCGANPCGANPCGADVPKPAANPCAAANPCNPCAAVTNPCGPAAEPAANPCAAAEPVELTPEQARAAYECLLDAMVDAYAQSGDPIARAYKDWPRFSTAPYVSATHGSRYVQNYAGPEAAEAYGRFEEIDAMPAGGRLAKDSFEVQPDGSLGIGPLFLMEKLPQGASPRTADWRYTIVMPNGEITAGEATQFCADCHAAVADSQDSLFFLPEEFRTTSR